MKRSIVLIVLGVVWVALTAARFLPADEPKAADKAEPPKAEEKKEAPKPSVSYDIPTTLDAMLNKPTVLKIGIAHKVGHDKPVKITIGGTPDGKPREKEAAPDDDSVTFSDLVYEKPGESELTVTAISDGVKEEAKIKVTATPFKLDVPSTLELVAGKPGQLEVKAYRVDNAPVEVKIFEVAKNEKESLKASGKIAKGEESTKIDLKYPKDGTYNLKVTASNGKDEADPATVTVTVRIPDPTGEKTGSVSMISDASIPDKVDKSGFKPKEIDEKSPNLKDLKENQDKSYEFQSKINDTQGKLTDALTSVGNFAGKNRVALNMMWTLITGFLVMFMQAGFAMVETGLTRSKNVAHTMAMNFMIYGLGMLGFWLCGFAIMFGGSGNASTGVWSGAKLLNDEYTWTLFGKPFGLFGREGFMLLGNGYDVGIMTLFLFQMVFMDTTATIPTGTMAERWKFLAFVVYGFFVGTIIYPVFGNWVWGGGWLSQLGANFGLGHGHVDFAGSSVVHMTGGVCALAGGLIIGPRIGKYNKDGTVNALPAHNVPMYMIGTFILAFGWFGFNPGSALQFGNDLIAARCAVNTMLASAAGAFASMVYMWIIYKKPDPSFMCNGMLAGLVAITAPCAFVTPWASVVIGLVAGVIVIWSCLFWEKIAKVDDPVGAISVHGVNGAWGVLALGLFADGTYGMAGWNNVYLYKDKITGAFYSLTSTLDPTSIPDMLKNVKVENLELTGVTGLFYGNASQFYAESIGVIANFAWVFVVSYVFFWLVEKTLGNRVPAADEVQGLDIPEMGVLGYINEDNPEGHITHASPDPKAAPAPANGEKRYTVVVDGPAPEALAETWSQLCLPSEAPPKDFLTVYRSVTTVNGNRFRFRSGDPETIRSTLERLFQGKLNNKTVRTTVEK